LILWYVLKSPLTPPLQRGGIITMFRIADTERLRVSNNKQKCSYMKFLQKLCYLYSLSSFTMDLQDKLGIISCLSCKSCQKIKLV